MTARLGPHTITVIRPGEKASDYGTSTEPDWDDTTDKNYKWCSVQPVTGAEFTVDRDNVTSRWQVWAPPSVDIRSSDRVAWNGATYDVDGEVQRWDFQPLDHLVIYLIRSEDS